MNTLLLGTSEEDISLAASFIKEGGVVGMPTETVYGLAANALDEEAVKRIFEAKGRPSDNPLIVHISDFEEIERFNLVSEVPRVAKLLADAFWPGPLTIIMPKSDNVPEITTGGLSTVAVRFPADKNAQRLIKAAGCPLAAPSANLSGSPSPTTANHVYSDMKGKIPAIIDGGECKVGLESTVVSIKDGVVTVLRPGGITAEDLMSVYERVEVCDAVLNKLKEGETALSPGMKYKHYSPNARVCLVKGSDRSFRNFVNKQDGSNTVALCYEEDKEHITIPTIVMGSKADLEAQAHNLFADLRHIDELEGVTCAYVRCPEAEGLGMAVLNRLIRAAGFEVINLEEDDFKIIGLTGQSGAGKSTVSEVFEKLGAVVINADKLAHAALKTEECKENLRLAFGGGIFDENGEVVRKALARAAFCSKENTEKLNRCTHPVIIELAKNEFDYYKRAGEKAVVFDAPTLFESGLNRLCSVVVSVIADKDLRAQRIMERDSLSFEDAYLRLNAQNDDKFYTEKSRYVIENNGTAEELIKKAEELSKELFDE
ncbi:MAG: threonylcarbamoyl-AMP synthase [Ruminococcus sp.]|nr:threonylcarbamoyl-AMP synthase [Ruminococcus sp.]